MLAGIRALIVTVSVAPLVVGVTVADPIGVVPRYAVTVPPADVCSALSVRQHQLKKSEFTIAYRRSHTIWVHYNCSAELRSRQRSVAGHAS